jgi:two-component system, OmpR family, response regulator
MGKFKFKILLAEDDPNLGNLLKTYLEAKGYATVLCVNGIEAYNKYMKDKFNFMILDVMMPLKDGFTLAKEIRKLDKNVPILFLTARSMEEDIIEGFQIGADDYLTKPFSMEELLLRINAILRRSNQKENSNLKESLYQISSYVFDYTKQTLLNKGVEIKLTSKEAELLKLLCDNGDEILDRTIALKRIWHDDSYSSARIMDVYMSKLRKIFKPDKNIEVLNIHGKGYRLLIK